MVSKISQALHTTLRQTCNKDVCRGFCRNIKPGVHLPNARIRFAAIVALLVAISAGAPAAPVETSVQVRGPAGPLRGTMLAPATSGSPVVLIIPGSGAVDRDGNGARGLKASTYKLIAEGLAAKGIATVRADKRGMYESAGAARDADAVTISDYTADVQSWVEVIRRQTGASCVWLLGHSEGGLVALATSSSVESICGLILVATAGRPMAQVLRDQLKSNSVNAALLRQALPAIDALEAGRHADTSSMDSALLPLFGPKTQNYLISEFSLDPAQLIANCPKPLLIMQGDRDIQVSIADAERLKQAAPDATLLLLPDANHVLKAVPSADWGANAATYADPHRPLAPGVIEGIAQFISPLGSASAQRPLPRRRAAKAAGHPE